MLRKKRNNGIVTIDEVGPRKRRYNRTPRSYKRLLVKGSAEAGDPAPHGLLDVQIGNRAHSYLAAMYDLKSAILRMRRCLAVPYGYQLARLFVIG